MRRPGGRRYKFKIYEPALRPLIEERVDVGLGIEWDQVVDFFAGADEADRQVQFAGDGYDDAAFGGTIEFGEHDAGDSGVAPEFAGLVEAVLPSGGVEYEQHIVRRTGNYFGGGALHFVQLGHEIGFGVQATGGVHDNDIGVTSTRGGERVENHGGGIGARFLFDHFYAGTTRPDFELLDGGRAKGVGGAEDYCCPFFFQAIREFADGGGFAGAIHSDDKQDPRLVGRFAICTGLGGVRCGENFQDLIFQFAFQGAGFFQFVFVHLLAERGEDFFGGADAKVCAEQRGFQLLQQFGVNRAVAGKQLFDAGGKFRASFADGIFQPLEERGFWWSEEGDHGSWPRLADHLIVANGA